MRENLTKNEILRNKVDIKRLFSKQSIRISEENLSLFYLKNKFSFNRILFCPAKKYGTAVERNRAKRVMREIYRKNKNKIITNFDMVLIIFPAKDDFKIREEQFEKLFKKAKLIS